MPEDAYNNPEFKAFAARVGAHVLPMIKESHANLSLVPDPEEVDIKFAVELGLSIMMDKPIILLVKPGMKIPDHLIRVADNIVEVDMSDPEQADAISERVGKILDQMDAEGKMNREGS